MSEDEYSESLETEFRKLEGALLNDTVRLLAPSEPIQLGVQATVAEAIDRMVALHRAAVVIVDGDLVWFVERGGRTALSFSADGDLLAAGAAALAGAVRDGRLGRISLSRVDSHDVFGASGPALDALVGAGFAVTPRGLRVAAGGARA